jgi:CheY-like chemotaxis protein
MPGTIPLGGPKGRARPRVVVADDQVGVLRAVSRLLAPAFEIVAAVTDGQQAVEVSARVDPDVVVLDITMPSMGGFEAAQALKRRGSRAKILFLTMHDEDKYVARAFNSGADGYVVKTRISPDLVRALEHVLAGQRLVPSLSALSALANDSGGHAALFYASDSALVDAAGSLVGSALGRGDMVLIVTRPEIRTGIAQRLAQLAVNVAAMRAEGRYLEQDSAEALSLFMPGGQFDGTRFTELVEDLERLRLATTGSRLTLLGEIAGPPCQDGDHDTTLRIERLWNRLTLPLPILGVCCYPLTSFHRDRGPELFPHLCAEHWAVSYASE